MAAVSNMMGSSSQSDELPYLWRFLKIFRYLFVAPFFPHVGELAGPENRVCRLVASPLCAITSNAPGGCMRISLIP